MTKLTSLLAAIALLTVGESFAQTITTTGMGINGQTQGLGSMAQLTLGLISPLDAPQLYPSQSTVTIGRVESKYPLKSNIVTTVFWVGEAASGANTTANYGSSWDQNWMQHFGGVDSPDARAAGYCPASFVPKQNPFYFALPYNDCIDNRKTKAQAARVIPWFKTAFKSCGKSVCCNRWIEIRHGERTCYAQWSDCGPFTTEDANYVFGSAPPSNTGNGGAGLDVSPAIRDFLNLTSGGKCDWRFVEANEVRDGPWKVRGRNNPFSKDWSEESDKPEKAVENSGTVVAKSKSSTPNMHALALAGLPGFKLKTVSK